MNFEQGQLTAIRYTDAEVEALNKLMLKNYEYAMRDINAQMEKFYGKYLSIKAGNTQDIYNIVIQYDRLNKLLAETQKTYSYYYKKVEKDIVSTSSLAMTNMYYRQQYILDWFTPIKMNFSLLDPRIVETAVTGTTALWKEIAATSKLELSQIVPQYGTLKDLLYTNKIKDLAKVQQTITQGFIQGQSIKEMSGNITSIMNNFAYQAERVARTEAARTADIGSRASSMDAADQGVDIQRQWHASRDGKTRDAHISLDGQRVDVDEPFSYGDMTSMGIGQWPDIGMNINCRCTIIDIVDGEEPQLMRARKNPTDPDDKTNIVMNFESYDKWSKQNGMKTDKNGMMIRDYNYEG
jgi:SPP1 gp7 family putative phage head morphogenesis protein